MIIGPRTIADKSFIQSLNSDLIDEMTLYFTMTSLPTLISEIIADLKKAPLKDGRIGEDLVRQLARKMTGAQGTEPPPLRSLVLGNLLGEHLDLSGLVLPVMHGSPGIESSEDGKIILISQIPQQKMWGRWAAGDFNTDDEAAAVAWRAGIEAVDLRTERETWKSFAASLGNLESLADVVRTVDEYVTDRRREVQLYLANLALSIVCAAPEEKAAAAMFFMRLPDGILLRESAPFAAHVARLYLCFAIGLAMDKISVRSSNVIDLQYLFYAPFCRVFISGDKLHRDLWDAGAIVSNGEFVWGDVFRADLRQRNDKRKAMTSEAWADHRSIYGHWPESVDGSIISKLWERHCPGWPRGGAVSTNVGKTIDEIDDPVLKAVFEKFNAFRRDK